MTVKVLTPSRKTLKMHGCCLNLGKDLCAYAELNIQVHEFCCIQGCLADPVSDITVCHFGGRNRNGMCVRERYYR